MAEKEKIKKKRSLFRKIVNFFLYSGIVFLIILLMFLGISQTATFREYLRSTVVNLANNSLNGHISIGKIDGTIFSSLYIRNAVVNMGPDTLLNSETIGLQVSPLQILVKRIYIRNIEIKNTKIDFISDSLGELNISKLFPSKPPDSTHSKFPFKIVVANLSLDNIAFTLQKYNKVGSNEKYEKLNMDDFRINDLILSLSGQADIANNYFEANIKRLSFSPNLKKFNLQNFSSKFFVSEKGVWIDGLNIVTGNSKLNLFAKVDGINIFDTLSVAKLEKAVLNVKLSTDKFNFDDLSSFVPSTNILKGVIDVDLAATGNLKSLNLNLLKVNYLNTHLEVKGNIREILEPDETFIDASFSKSKIDVSNINKLIPSANAGSLTGVINIDTLNYKGNPQNFTASLFARNGKGSLDLKAALDFRNINPGYKVSFETNNFDLRKLTGLPIVLTSKGSIAGAGFEPENMNSEINVFGGGSIIDGNKFDTLKISALASNKKINFALNALSDSTKVSFAGLLDFTQKGNPAYTLNGFVKNLNLVKFINDSTLQSNLNFNIDASGNNFDLDKINLYASLDLKNSIYNGITLNHVRAIADIRSNDNGERVINLISDIADITLQGNFSITQTIKMMSDESALISKDINYKYNEIFQPQNNFNKQVQTGISIPIRTKPVQQIYANSDINYQVEFKNFDLISSFLKNNHLSVSGSLSGEIKNNSDTLNLSLNSSFDYIKYWNDQNVFFTTGLNFNTTIKNSLNAQSLKDINIVLNTNADRIFAGTNITKFVFALNLLNDSASVKLAAKVNDNLDANLDGNIYLSGNILQTDILNLKMIYNQFNLQNQKNITIEYSQDRIDVKNFKLFRNNSFVDVEGFLSRTGNQNLRIVVSNLSGFDFGTSFLGLNPGNDIDANLNLTADINGNYYQPTIKLNFEADTVSFKDQVFGTLVSKLNYSDQTLSLNINFLDSTLSKSNSELQLSGEIPIDLAFVGAGERLIESRQLNIRLSAKNFNLSALGNSLPSINKLKGTLTSSLIVAGTYAKPLVNGQLEINNADFIVDANNLEYNAGIKISIDNKSLSLDSLLIANTSQIKEGGIIRGSGNAVLDNLNIVSSQFKINGDLKVLSNESKYASPAVYGDLVIATNGDIEFSANSKGEYLHAPIIIKNANLTFPPVQEAYQNSSSNFIYRFAYDSVKEKKNQVDVESLIKLAQKRSQLKKSETSKKSTFDYSIDVSVQKEATLKFVISKELDQNLTALLKGDFQYQMISGRSNAQGELTLLDGSTMEFLKTFDAGGTIRFESELSNPYLNVVATYKNDYIPPTGDNKVEPVAIKIRLKGPLKDLSKSFLSDPNNISVYVGADNINNNVADQTKDENDALMFILQGQFAADLTAQQQSSAIKQAGLVTGAATSIAGSMLGGFLNRYLGDYVKGVELRSVGSTTQFNLVGKLKDFKYTIGGSTDVFQDLSQANIKIEYPVYKSLILRLERKQAITQTTISNEMVNELGLQYKFEF